MAESRAAISVNVKEFIQEAFTVLKNPKDNSEVSNILNEILHLLSSKGTDACIKSRFPEPDLTSARRLFAEKHQGVVLEFLISQFTVEWMKDLSSTAIKLVDKIFLHYPHTEVFLALCNAVTVFGCGYKLNKCVGLLEDFIVGHRIQQMLSDQCTDALSLKDIDVPFREEKWSEIVNYIASLPERVTNKLGKETNDLFFPQNFIPVITSDLLICMEFIHSKLRNNKDCSMKILSMLVGKLCMLGHGDAMWPMILQKLVPSIAHDALWSRMTEQLINRLPDRHMEASVIPLLKHAQHYGIVGKFLGHSAYNNKKLQYLVTTKLLLMRHSSDDCILQNIIGYLAMMDILKPLFIGVIQKLLDVWGDSSAIKHTSYEQHLYMTKAILICTAFMMGRDQLKIELKDDLLRRLMPGVQNHLGSGTYQVRRLGMVVAEHLTGALDQTGQKLSFEYDKDDEVECLEKLLIIPQDPGIEYIQNSFGESVTVSNPMDETKNLDNLEKLNEAIKANSDSELDSDDDLEPYDMSHDVKVSKVKAPMYVRDCMEGLISNDDPERVESCLQSAENLIRNHASNSKEIAAELCKILLHLDNNSAIPGFQLYRFKSLVALCVIAPIPVSKYLTHQFYERNYNLRQRMDMLEVLAAAAQEISGIKHAERKEESAPRVAILEETENDVPSDNWRAIVQKRIDSKTRIISHGSIHPKLQAQTNTFADLAGHFFFPLVANFDKAADNTFDLLGDDHVLLSRLMYTLGVIVYAASHCLAVRQIGKALLEFVWVFRYHNQSGVRCSLLFALSMFSLAVPGHMMLSDLQLEVTEVRQWLEYVTEKDEDKECQKLAVQVLVLMEQNIKKELESMSKQT